MKKTLIFLLSLAVLFSCSVFCAGASSMPEEYDDFLSTVPEDILERLPEGMFSDDTEEFVGAVGEISSFGKVWNFVCDLLGIHLKDALFVFLSLCGLIALSGLLRLLADSLRSEEMAKLLPLISSVAVTAAILELLGRPMAAISSFFETMTAMVDTATPLVCSLYAMGGNVGTAVVQNGGFMIFLSVSENLCALGLRFMSAVCLSLAVASVFAGNENLTAIGNALKRAFTFIVGLFVVVFSTVMSAQTLLSVKADSLGTKAMKVVVGRAIPFVGSTVGETLRAAGAGIEYLRSGVGIGAVILFLLLTIPTVLSVFCFRLAFLGASGIASLVGCERESKLLSEIASIFGYTLAVLSMCVLMLLFLFVSFARCGAVLG